MSRNKYVLILLLLGLIGLAYAQHPDTAWVRTYNGPGNYCDYAYAIALRSDTVYVTGASATIADWPYSFDYATVKYLPNGDTAWVRRYNGTGNDVDEAKAIAVDGAGNVYVTGRSMGLSGPEWCREDYLTIKYNSDGVEQWVSRYDGPGNGSDYAKAIALRSDTVYVTGQSSGSGTSGDYATIKYLPNGDTAWLRRYDGPANSGDQANAIAVDGAGNVYVTGQSDNDPDPYIYNIDYATVKYTPAGDTTVVAGGWVQRYNGPGNEDDYANAIAVDGAGNVYVTGNSGDGSGRYTQDYATIKYNSTGDTAVANGGWVRRYNGPENDNDAAWAIALRSDTVYVTGNSYSPISNTSDDYATIKYLPNGDTAWVRTYNGPVGWGWEYPSAIAVDGTGNVYVTGRCFGSGYSDDYATVKYNSAGVQQWDARYNGPTNGEDQATAIAVDGAGNVYVTGHSATSEEYPYNFDYTTIKYSTNLHWIITATAGDHGSIDPLGEVEVEPGADQSFTITPEFGYHVADVLVDDVSVGAETIYTFEDVTADHTIYATFAGWTQKESMPTGVPGKYVKAGGALVRAYDFENYSDVLYALRGNKSKEFYMYNGTWTAKETIPYGYKYPLTEPPKINKKYPGKGAALCWNGDSIIYATKGNSTQEFWMYNTNANTWTAKAFVPVPKALKGGTSIAYLDGKVYLLAGGQKKTDLINFYVYDPTGDTALGTPWTPLGLLTLGPNIKIWKDGACLTELGGTLYALKSNDKYNPFFSYNIVGNTWTEFDSIPMLDSVAGKRKKIAVKDGGAMTSGNGAIYAIKGGGANVFWKFDGVAWSKQESIPRLHKKSVPKTGAALAYAWGKLYLLKGNNTPEFWRYYIPSSFDFVARPFTPSTITSVMTEKTMTTSEFNFAVAPNPFTKLATIRYTVPVSGKVSIKLYNASGRLVETMVNEYVNAGAYTTRLSSDNLAKGVYFVKYETNNSKAELKLIVQ